MKLNLSVSRDIKLLSLGFLLIFLGFNGVQQYVTLYFSDAGLIDLGFQSLILIYLFFMIFDPLSAIFVSKYGAKRSMIIASIFYSIFILTLLSKSILLIYLGSSLLGIAAALLWTGQNSYLIRASDKKAYGASSGIFNSFQSLGSTIGVFILGFLISIYLFKLPFLVFSIFPIIGALLLLGLKDFRAEPKTNHFRLVKKSITSKTALKLSSIWFSVNFVFGLVIGIIPLQIKSVLGVSYVGALAALFYVLPILLSYVFGRWSDTKGRKNMILASYLLLVTGLISMALSSQAIFLILGIGLLALNWAIIKPITMALVGDVAGESNLEFLTALFWMVQNIGVVSALLLSQIFRLDITSLYIISALVVIASLVILLPLLRSSTENIREKISHEMK